MSCSLALLHTLTRHALSPRRHALPPPPPTRPDPTPDPLATPPPCQVKPNVEAQIEKKMYLNYLQSVSEIILTDEEVETLDD